MTWGFCGSPGLVRALLSQLALLWYFQTQGCHQGLLLISRSQYGGGSTGHLQAWVSGVLLIDPVAC